MCSPGLPTIAGKCTKGKTARAAMCAVAPLLDPGAGITVAAGRSDGVSLWEPPSGCTNAENTEHPEGIVALHLASAAKTLTITTQRPETDLDTVLYLLPGCPDDTSTAVDCNDDDGTFASTLTLSDVPAGDYTIVVESGRKTGRSFGVSVSAE